MTEKQEKAVLRSYGPTAETLGLFERELTTLLVKERDLTRDC